METERPQSFDPLFEIARPAALPRRRRLSAAARAKAWARRNGLFLVMVLMPTLLAVLYYGLIAAPIYASVSSYVMRTPNANSWSMITNILQTAGLARTRDDAFVVNEFIRSRDAVAFLERRFDLRGHYASQGDPISAFPGLFGKSSFERLHRYIQGKIDVDFDPTTGINRLAVRSFDPAYSRALNDALLRASEDLVNRINQRWREDAIAFAAVEVAAQEEALQEAQRRITRFRTESLLVDPKQMSEELGKTLIGLAWELAQARTRLRALEPAQSDSPQADNLNRSIASLEGQLAEERAKIAGRDDSIAQTIVAYERLFMEQEFAERALISAMASLESAKQDAQRQQLYLERVVEPSAPDHASHPKRFLNILIVFTLAFAFYVLARVLIKEVEAHDT